MNTLIINGSPNGGKGNTEIFIRQFLMGCQTPYEVAYAAKENPAFLAERLKEFDAVLFFIPMYVFAMPGIVMKLIEEMVPSQSGQRIGFVVQYGFAEGAQAQYIKRYSELLAKRLQYKHIGTITKGNAAGVGMMPETMNKKLFSRLRALGRHYSETGTFDCSIEKEMEKPYHLSKAAAMGNEMLNSIGVSKIFWHKMLRDNNAFNNRLDKPFAPIE